MTDRANSKSQVESGTGGMLLLISGRGILLVSFLLLPWVCGCAALGSLTAGKGAAEAPALSYQTGSRLDSLVRAGGPVDTLVLAPSTSRGTQLAGRTLDGSLRAPASLEAGPVFRQGGFRVQIASSENRKELERLISRVEREFEAKSHLEQYEGRWCLRVGDFPDRAAAEALRARAVDFGFKYAWVVQTTVPLVIE